MLVRDLVQLLERENPASPVTLEGYCPHGEYLIEDDVYMDHDEGPSADVDTVNICWWASNEDERRAQPHSDASARSRRLP
ncbi:MAG: hypothetical protein ACLGIA_10015 [Actinomycetes bacterium]